MLAKPFDIGYTTVCGKVNEKLEKPKEAFVAQKYDYGERFEYDFGEVLFNLLSNRNEKGSMVITTNLSFNRWNEVFDDPVLTGAIVDRIAHKAHVVDMTGESYRVLETKEWMNKTNKKLLTIIL